MAIVLSTIVGTTWALERVDERSDTTARSDSNWTARRDRFHTLLGRSPTTSGHRWVADLVERVLEGEPGDAERLARELIRLLEVENACVEQADSLSSAYLNYYGNVIWAVAVLGEADVLDIGALDALLGAITTGGMATRTIASFGDAAVAPLGKLLDHPDSRVRKSAVRTLGRIAPRLPRQAPERSSQLEQLTSLVHRASRDPSPFVRWAAVRVLARLGDPESIARVREIAQRDPYQAEPEYTAKAGQFLVREAAMNALKENGFDVRPPGN